MKHNYLIMLLPLAALFGCTDSSERSSTPVNSPTKAATSDLRAVLDRADEIEKTIAARRVDFHDQTGAVVSQAQAYLAANMSNYSYTASGAEARMIQENYIKELKIAGLDAERSLLQAYLPLGRAALSGKRLLAASEAAEMDLHKSELLISGEIAQFKKYLDSHREISFPSQSKFSSRSSSISGDTQANRVEGFDEIELPDSGESISEAPDGGEVVE